MFKALVAKIAPWLVTGWGLGVAQVVVIVLGVVLLGLLVWLMPALLVWSVNELLEQSGVAYQIAWNVWSWLAALGLVVLVRFRAFAE